MTLVFLPLFLFYILYTTIPGEKHPERCCKYLAYAVCSWGIALFAVTEILSVFEVLTKTGLMISWSVINTVLLGSVCYTVHKKKFRIFSTEKDLITEYINLSNGYRMGYLLIGLSFIAVLILSRITVPYNWDSMTYHLPRIMFWAQSHSVAHFATEDARQLSSPVFAEFVNLHLYILRGDDSCFNLLQGMSYCLNAFFVYSISRSLGLDRKWSILAEALFMSAPIVFAEALTTQVDQVAAVWMVIFAYFVLLLADREHIVLSDKESTIDITILGISAGFGYITKPSVGIAMAVYSIGLLVVRFRKKDKVSVLLAAPFIVAAAALLIMLPEFVRNYLTFNALSTPDVGAQQLVGTLSPLYLLVNLIKNFAFNLPNVYIPELSGFLYRFVIFVAGSLRVDINDRSISERGMEYVMNAADDIGHDTAINAIIVSLFILVILTEVVRLLKKRRPAFNMFCWCSVI